MLNWLLGLQQLIAYFSPTYINPIDQWTASKLQLQKLRLKVAGEGDRTGQGPYDVVENPYYYDYHYHWGACLDGAPNGCSCDYEDGLKCRTYGSGAWYQSRCCYCDEQIIGGKCVKCTETDGDCTADC